MFALVFAIFRIVSLASLCASVSLPAFVYIAARSGLAPFEWSIEGVSIFIMLIVVVKHRSNLRRLMSGTEKKLGRVRSE